MQIGLRQICLVAAKLRIVIDLQGAQTSASRSRGVGRYSLALAKAIAATARHEILISLNDLFPDTIEPLRAAFEDIVPQEQIVVWQTLGPTAAIEPANRWRMEVGERLRESFLASLKPDLVYVSSLFEGLVDDGLTTIGAFQNADLTAMTLYDLIPLLHRDLYLSNPINESWYERKIGSLRRANLWLAISESSRREGIDYLTLPEDWVVNISTAADHIFRPIEFKNDVQQSVRRRYGLERAFVLYTGGIDHRKNIGGLINAYARLPNAVRRRHQLAIVCAASSDETNQLRQQASRCDLRPDDIVFTGFVPDDDLVALYNLCQAFVFPSWHEGFGLPALEAMSCGSATIGANTSSVPEVIGRSDALFDPLDPGDIAAKLCAVLTDETFNQDLRRHGLQQAKNFSWANTARQAVDAFERLDRHKRATSRIAAPATLRPRLAYVSPLPPQKSGIADYSAELLPELARHYDIETIVKDPAVNDSWIQANIPIRSAQWFDHNASLFDRVLYHFGNSEFHQHMFDLLARHPGTVVLHDFFLSGVIAHMDWTNYSSRGWETALFDSHGYHALSEKIRAKDPADIVWKYPTNLGVLKAADGVIVHSEFSQKLADTWYGPGYSADWARIPHLRKPPRTRGRADVRRKLGFQHEDFVVCSFGVMGPTKCNHRLLASWLASPLAHDPHCHLVFVGARDDSGYGAALTRSIAKNDLAARIHVTGFASPAIYRQYLEAADVAVQLRALSRGETSGTVLDCLAYGVPTVVNLLGAVVELPADCVFRLRGDFSDAELRDAVLHLRQQPSLRSALHVSGIAHVHAQHSPRSIADQYHEAIERFARTGPSSRIASLADQIAQIAVAPNDSDDVALAQCIAQNELTRQPGLRHWFVDISELVRHDWGSGIQRVVRGVMLAWLNNPPSGFRAEPIYWTEEGIYRYARRYSSELLAVAAPELTDDPIEFRNGDVFFAPDLFFPMLQDRLLVYETMRRHGVRLYFVVHDLLLVNRPDLFPPGGGDAFHSWLTVLATLADGALCVSRATANDLSRWLDSAQIERQRPLGIAWVHLGADINMNIGAHDVKPGFDETLKHIREHPSILMVGTIEPRKCHAQALAALETLWDRGLKANLVIVGKSGWMVERLVKQLREHPRLGQHLFWFDGATDEELRCLYQAASGLLMASEGEGFGLPLIEAARYGVPVLARDIPVFREVAGEHASYFAGSSTEALANALSDWLTALSDGSVPDGASLPYQTWEDTTRRITDVIIDNDWASRWHPNSQTITSRAASNSTPAREFSVTSAADGGI